MTPEADRSLVSGGESHDVEFKGEETRQLSERGAAVRGQPRADHPARGGGAMPARAAAGAWRGRSLRVKLARNGARRFMSWRPKI